MDRLSAPAALVLTLLAACGGGPRNPAPAPADLLGRDEMVALCERLHKEAVPCARSFVAMNLDLRSRYSPDFAAQLRDPGARQAAEEQGAAETVADADRAHERCTEYARPEWGPAQPRSDLAKLDQCYAQLTCDAKMACVRPLIEPRFAYRAAHPGGPH